jgi:hypothetical protein
MITARNKCTPVPPLTFREAMATPIKGCAVRFEIQLFFLNHSWLIPP